MMAGPTNIAAAGDEALDAYATESEGHNVARLLAFVEREAHVSQRALASELGVALGLVNIYIKRCVKKGLIKVQEVPSRRYAYYLTPSGLAEKSRLTAEYLSWSLSFFRRARAQCTALLEEARERKLDSLALYGGSDLTEIAILCASELGVAIVAVVDEGMRKQSLFNIPVVAALDGAPNRPDGAIITGIHQAQHWYGLAAADLGADRVLVPPMLSVRTEGAGA